MIDQPAIRASGVHDWTPKILAVFIVVAVLGIEGSVMFFGLPAGVDQVIVGRVLGTLDTILTLVASYHFGSSAGAARGQELLAQAGAIEKPIALTDK